MEVINYLLGYENLKIYQNTKMFQFSLDSVLLANFVTLNKNIKSILDIGTGNAVIPLILSTKTPSKIIGVEIQKESYELACKSVKLNKLNHQIEIINNDIKLFYQNIDTETFDVITCNPPFFKMMEQSKLNDSTFKMIARHEISLNLEDIVKISKKILKNNGRLALVHRPERLAEIITIMKNNNIEPKKICFVYPKQEKEANILLIEGVKNGKPGIKVMPPIITHNFDGSYSDQVKCFFK